MPQGNYELVQTADGYTARISARGVAVLATPTINRGTAFTFEERPQLGLTGLLPRACRRSTRSCAGRTRSTARRASTSPSGCT